MKKTKESKEESNKDNKTSAKEKTFQPVSENQGDHGEAVIKELQQANQALVVEIDSLKELKAEHEDFIKRQKAEFDNYRKRVLEEKEKNILFAGETIMKSFLTIYDNYANALRAEVKNDEVNVFLEGFKIIRNEMDKFMEEQKVSTSTKVGDEFDPNIHQAILFDESSEVKTPSVSEVFQEGYLMNGRLLRTAMVKVTKPIESAEAIKKSENKTTETSNKEN